MVEICLVPPRLNSHPGRLPLHAWIEPVEQKVPAAVERTSAAPIRRPGTPYEHPLVVPHVAHT